MKRTRKSPSVVIAFVLASFAACSTPLGIPTPEERLPLATRQAVTDLRCAESELSARHLGSRLFTVSGCGRQITYRVICKIGIGSCYLISG